MDNFVVHGSIQLFVQKEFSFFLMLRLFHIFSDESDDVSVVNDIANVCGNTLLLLRNLIYKILTALYTYCRIGDTELKCQNFQYC